MHYQPLATQVPNNTSIKVFYSQHKHPICLWPQQKLEERFRINRRELIPLEFQVLVALEMGLYLPESKVMPHYRRLVKQG